MIRLLFPLALTLLPISVASAQPSPAPVVIGETFEFSSTVMGEAREINVWVPPSYAEGDRRYPVLYLIDGARDQDFHHISGLAQLATINGAYREMIVVGIGTKVRTSELTPTPTDPRFVRGFPTSGQAERFRNYIADEVIPFIEARYRTDDQRVLIGESLAGLFVVDTYLKAPNLFDDYVAASPSVWWDGERLAAAAPRLLARHDATPHRLYLTMGDEGGTMQSAMDTLLLALREHAPAGLALTWVDRRTSETHATIYHGAAYDALERYFAYAEPYEPGPYPWWLTPNGQPPAN
ncbi:putative esterase [alpha proteobacterium U9-1i]|nr:putative esterase [alpha proteobacterium U9-1i]